MHLSRRCVSQHASGQEGVNGESLDRGMDRVCVDRSMDRGCVDRGYG